MIIISNTIKDFVHYVVINKLKINFTFFFIVHFVIKLDTFSNILFNI